MVKTRVSTRFKSAVGGKSHNKSEDLQQLTEKYNAFNKILKSFIGVLKQHYAAMEALTKSRIEMAQHITVLSRSSPLSNHVSAMPASGAPPDSVCSYLSTHHNLANKNNQFAQRFAKFVIDYCIQWQQVVSTRIDKTLKEAEKSRVEADHYQSKVESLRQSANEKLAKGKQVDAKSAEKLTRNEEKLVNIKDENKKRTADACLLVEELTDRAWRDLHPLLVKIIQFDMTISSEEAKALGGLKAIVTELKNIAATHGISEDARLKEIETLAPSDLSTSGDNDTVQVESEMGRMSFSGGTNGGMPNQGGATLPQGSGGFPVPIKTPSAGMSTVDMVAISAAAAPPPSMDQLEAAFGSSNSSLGSEVSAPPVSAPPLPPADTNPFGPAPIPAPAPSVAPVDTNPFGSGSAPTTPSMYGAASTNPFSAAPIPAPAGSTNPFGGAPSTPSASSTNPFADPPSAYPAPSPYAATPPMAPPPQQFSGQQMVPMYGNTGMGTPTASGYGLPYTQQGYGQQQQQQQQQQQRRTSSNPFD